MVIVKIVGGLGNQLSTFSVGYTVAKYLKQPLVLDISDYMNGYFRPYMLDYFNISAYRKVYFPISTFHSIEGIPRNIRNGLYLVDTNTITSHEELINMVNDKDNIYLQGYGGINLCSDEDRREICAMFGAENNRLYIDSSIIIDGKCSVAIHVRRSDFIRLGWSSDEARDYYNYAVEYYIEKLSKPIFYLFSDDIGWARKNVDFKGTKYIVVDHPGEDITDFLMMSLCRYHILTDRSTFGLWSCILSKYPEENIINVDSDSFSEKYQFLNLSVIDEKEFIKDSRKISTVIAGNVDETEKNCVYDYIQNRGCKLFQEGQYDRAFLCFYSHLDKREDSDLLYNYASCLDVMGRDMHSLIYIAAYDRECNTESLCPDTELYRNIYNSIRKNNNKSYLFYLVKHYDNAVSYLESIAVLMKRLGYTVKIRYYDRDYSVDTDDIVVVNNVACLGKINEGNSVIFVDTESEYDLDYRLYGTSNDEYANYINARANAIITNNARRKYDDKKCFSIFSGISVDQGIQYSSEYIKNWETNLNTNEIVYVMLDILLLSEKY